MRWRDTSLSVLLCAALAGVVTIVLGAAAVLAYGSLRDDAWARLDQSVSMVADQQAAGLAIPLWNLDEADMHAVMVSGMRQREVVAVSIESPGYTHAVARGLNGRLVGVAAVPAIEAALHVQVRQVHHDDDRIGVVRVYASGRDVEQDLARLRLVLGGGILVLDLVLVLALYGLLWRLLVRPVKGIERYTAAAAGAGEGSPAEPPPLETQGVGELRTLGDSVRTMTERLAHRAVALVEVNERLALAARAARLGIWDWDVGEDDAIWDDQMYRFFGRDPTEFPRTADAFRACLDDTARREVRESIRAALRGDRSFAFEVRFRRLTDGVPRILAVEGAMLRDGDGRVHRVVGVAFDVTEQRESQAALGRLNAALEERVRDRTAQLESTNEALGRARDAAESATRAKSEFLANMSHEIRTPINAILGMTHLALRTDPTPRQQECLAKIRLASETLLGIVNDVLDFSKIEAGRLDLETAEFDVHDALHQLQSLLGVRAQEKGLALHVLIADDVPRHLLGDRLRLSQILLNLGSNAVKFTAHGQVEVTVVRADPPRAGSAARSRIVAGEESMAGAMDDEPAAIRVVPVEWQQALPAAHAPGLREQDLAAGAVRLSFIVRDTGVGMTEPELARLFRPFEQGDASTSRRFGGTGLGLAISRQLAALMGGTIQVESRPGQGSTFRFEAPFGVADVPWSDHARHPPAVPARAVAPASLRGRDVLLVEDNELNQQVASGLLQEVAGVHVTVAPDGSDAVRRIVDHGERFDAVLMDVQMPGMDGHEATRRIRAAERDDAVATGAPVRRLPIIAMTAHAMLQEKQRCAAAGMDDFVTKPFEPSDLFHVLSKWIDVVGALPASEAPVAPEPSVPSVPFADDGPLIDVEVGRRRCAGNAALHGRMMALFVTTSSGAADDVRRALDGDQASLAVHLLHTLRGSAGAIGATALGQAATALESALRDGAPGPVRQAAEARFAQRLDATLAEIASLAVGGERVFAATPASSSASSSWPDVTTPLQ